MLLCHFEDAAVAHLEPLACSRPAFELLCGLDSVRTKQEYFFGLGSAALVVRPHLVKLWQRENQGLLIHDRIPRFDELMILVNGRWLPPQGTISVDNDEHAAWIDDELAYAIIPPGLCRPAEPDRLEEWIALCACSLPRRPAGGALLRHLWDYVSTNARQLCLDFDRWLRTMGPNRSCARVTLVGPSDRLWLGGTTQVEPMVLADTTHGPVVIDEGAALSAFTRLEGPCYVGSGTQLRSARIRGGTTLGQGCRIGGEVESCLVQGYSNKSHEGFLGHAYLGEWVNLGAGTHNSDLRNDYGVVSVVVDGTSRQTGLNKVGCFIGDHTKTSIGTLLNTGTNVGVFCNLLPSGPFVPKFVPSFCTWSQGHLLAAKSLDRLFQTATTVMARRDKIFSAEHADLYRAVFAKTGEVREQYLRHSGKTASRRIA